MKKALHTAEVVAFVLAGTSGLSRFFNFPVAYGVSALLGIILYAVFYSQVRKLTDLSPSARGIYLNNLCIVILAPLFCLYQPCGFVVGCLMLLVAVSIGVRIVISPDAHPTKGSRFTQGF
ncbi:MAG: hypothetical protein LKJ44_02635 [Bifidobacteriaceae bacterium]|jgi:cadmium resistance protein CadD (predicted permease)|nr:hypothetical protein [Bifidobacteriaceae bacterium]MCI1978600.1 hypothetical protein [Bifidobacteriaceae bacterium]